MTQCDQRDVLDELIAALIDHTQNHFLYEEQLMLQRGYPGYARHKDQHDQLIEHILALAEQYRNGDLLLSFAVMVDLKGWALVHIEKFDVALGAFLNRTQSVAGVDDPSSRNGTQ
jgi:hemerythrin-like metal-binding protein